MSLFHICFTIYKHVRSEHLSKCFLTLTTKLWAKFIQCKLIRYLLIHNKRYQSRQVKTKLIHRNQNFLTSKQIISHLLFIPNHMQNQILLSKPIPIKYVTLAVAYASYLKYIASVLSVFSQANLFIQTSTAELSSKHHEGV